MKKISKLIGLSLLLSLCMFGCATSSNVAETVEAVAQTESAAAETEKPYEEIVWATKDGLAFDLSSYGNDKEAINILVFNENNGRSLSIFGPEKDFVLPYVEANTEYRINIIVNDQEQFEKTVTAKAGKGELFIESQFAYFPETNNIQIAVITDSLVKAEKYTALVYFGTRNNGVSYFQADNKFDVNEKSFRVNLFDLYANNSQFANVVFDSFLFRYDLSELNFAITIAKYVTIDGASKVLMQSDRNIRNLELNTYKKPEIITSDNNGLHFDFTKLPTDFENAKMEIRGLNATAQTNVLYTIPFSKGQKNKLDFPFVDSETWYEITIYDQDNYKMLYTFVQKTNGQGHKTCEYDIAYDTDTKNLTITPQNSTEEMLLYFVLDSPSYNQYLNVLFSDELSASFLQDATRKTTSSTFEIAKLNLADSIFNLMGFLNYSLDYLERDELSFKFFPTFAFVHDGRTVTTTNYEQLINGGNYFTYKK